MREAAALGETRGTVAEGADDLVEGVGVVDGARRVGEVEGLLHAQQLPLVRVVLVRARGPARAHRHARARADRDRHLVVAATPTRLVLFIQRIETLQVRRLSQPN